MRGLAVWIAGVAVGLAACAGSAATSGVPSTAAGTMLPAPGASGAATGSPPSAPFPAAPSPTVCPGRTWPPYPVGAIPGIVARSVDRATVEITNRTGRTVYYRVSGWEPGQFETCRALGEVEVQRGPLAPGAIERVMIDSGWQRAGVPITVALWDRPCGETCAREPVGMMVVRLSPAEPAAS